jgi:hypothetical protein
MRPPPSWPPSHATAAGPSCESTVSIGDPHHFDADPDSDYLFYADPDSDFLFDANPDTTFRTLMRIHPDPRFKKEGSAKIGS